MLNTFRFPNLAIVAMKNFHGRCHRAETLELSIFARSWSRVNILFQTLFTIVSHAQNYVQLPASTTKISSAFSNVHTIIKKKCSSKQCPGLSPHHRGKNASRALSPKSGFSTKSRCSLCSKIQNPQKVPPNEHRAYANAVSSSPSPVVITFEHYPRAISAPRSFFVIFTYRQSQS